MIFTTLNILKDLAELDKEFRQNLYFTYGANPSKSQKLAESWRFVLFTKLRLRRPNETGKGN